MLTTDVGRVESEDALPRLIPDEMGSAQGVIAWSSFVFALLQSVCTFFTALDGFRLLIGVSSLAAIIQAGAAWDHFHADWIRIPMMGFALVGASLNLVVLIHVRHLRNRPASQWRQKPLTPRKISMERVQFILSFVTLALIGIEELTHLRTFHRL